MSNAAKVVQLTKTGSAVLITDTDPEEVALINNAWKVLEHSSRMLREELTEGELRFTAQQLAVSLREVLDVTGGSDEEARY